MSFHRFHVYTGFSFCEAREEVPHLRICFIHAKLSEHYLVEVKQNIRPRRTLVVEPGAASKGYSLTKAV
jgi:hypothetical protein